MARNLLVAFLLLIPCCLTLPAQNWERFRGNNGTGIVELPGFPVNWSESDYDWRVELPGVGHSSPVVHGKLLFVTSAVDEGAVRYLHCLNADSGKLLWSRLVGMNRSHKHAKSSWASSTPATDGKRVYIAFADKELLTLAAYDHAGELLWRRNLGAFTSQHGHGVSPILHEDLVILANDQQGPSSVMAFEAATGTLRWSTLRSVRRTSYSTPFILKRGQEPAQLICLSGAMGLTSLNPRSGQTNWVSGELPLRTVASPILAGGVIVATCGGGGKGKLLIAIEPDGTGLVGESHLRYSIDRTLPYVPTPVAREHYVYLWNDNGVVSCIDSESGEFLWTKRVGGNFSGSPVCVNGVLYCMSEEGDLVILDASPDYRLHGRIALGDGSHATPAVANGAMYLRTFSALYRLPAKGP